MIAQHGAKLDITANFPWTKMPGKMVSEYGIKISSWPIDVRVPGDPKQRALKGLSSLPLHERRKLAIAFIDPERPLVFERLDLQHSNINGKYLIEFR